MKTKTDALIQHNAAQSERADKFALDLKPVIDELKEAGFTFHRMAEALNKRRLRTPRGHFWSYRSVQNVCARIEAIEARSEDNEMVEDEFFSPVEHPEAA